MTTTSYDIAREQIRVEKQRSRSWETVQRFASFLLRDYTFSDYRLLTLDHVQEARSVALTLPESNAYRTGLLDALEVHEDYGDLIEDMQRSVWSDVDQQAQAEYEEWRSVMLENDPDMDVSTGVYLDLSAQAERLLS